MRKKISHRLLILSAVLFCSALPFSYASAQIASNAPAWAEAMTPGTWGAISQNKISDVDPSDDADANPNYPNSPPWRGSTGQASVTVAWNGGALATGYPAGGKGSLIAWGGGHRDYYGNEIYAFDLASQRWARLTDPYPNTVFPVTDGIWPDGTPSVPHTYGFVGYHPGTNSFVSMSTQISNAPSRAALPVFFDFDTMKWRRGVRNSASLPSGGWAVYDSSRDSWWAQGGDSGGAFARYSMNGDGTSGSWTNYTPKLDVLDARAARDPVNDILVMTTFNQNTNIYGLDLKNPSAAPVQLTQSGSPPSRSGKHGWEWSEALKAFVYWRSGGDVYQVKPPAGDWKTGSWVWSKLTSSGNAVTPSEPQNGVYNRFRLVRYADMEVGVVVNDVGGNVYAFRLPGTPPPASPSPRAPTDVTAN